MSLKNLVLGANWGAGEWPDHVDVSHTGSLDCMRYVPERTCHDEAEAPQSFLCGECGWFWTDWDGFELEFHYCPNCGARIKAVGECGR